VWGETVLLDKKVEGLLDEILSGGGICDASNGVNLLRISFGPSFGEEEKRGFFVTPQLRGEGERGGRCALTWVGGGGRL